MSAPSCVTSSGRKPSHTRLSSRGPPMAPPQISSSTAERNFRASFARRQSCVDNSSARAGFEAEGWQSALP
ncbi:hypothetical protein OH491_24430 [Termitidicoccus mucosus]|uniref:hypothetical protein n=1 Tax=Termitidicoccus mucosus TaxID=1184151 RepID=UPI0011AB7401